MTCTHIDNGPLFPPDGTPPGNRFGWGCVVFDTYMDDSLGATDALVGVAGPPVGQQHWGAPTAYGPTVYGRFVLGFSYDKTSGTGITVKAIADKCRNKGVDGGREMDGDRQTPSKDDRSWSF